MKRASVNQWYLAGICLIATLILSYVLSSVVFLMGGRIGCWIFPAAAIISLATTLALASDKASKLTIIVSSIATILISVTVCSILVDFSWDGNIYHQESIALMLKGWNPFTDPLAKSFWPEYYTGKTYLSADGVLPTTGHGALMPWVIHYAIAVETVGSTIASATGLIESGKAFGMILAAGTGMLIYGFLAESKIIADWRRRLTVTLISVLNPVFICQSLTYYNDYPIYYYLLATIILLIKIGQRRDRWYDIALMCGVIMLAIGTKFNAFFIEGIAIMAGALWFLITSNNRALLTAIAVGAISLIVGVCIISYHPYVTNLMTAGHPLYPLMGENTFDIMSYNTPERYANHNRFFGFIDSISTICLPNYGSREGGFGPAVTLIMLISLAVIIWKRKAVSPAGYYILGVTVVSLFFFEQSWWARYIPQLWLIPVVASVYAAQAKKDRWVLWLLASAVAVNAIACSLYPIADSIHLSLQRNRLYDQIEGQTVGVKNCSPQVERHLNENNIAVEKLPFDTTFTGDSAVIYGNVTDPYYAKILIKSKATN